MARGFTSSQAGKLIGAHQQIHTRVSQARQMEREQREEIRQAAEKLRARETSRLLETIPVEELNQNKEGIKTKTLADANFKTVAAVRRSSLYALEAIRGISAEGARLIHKKAEEYAQKAEKTVKIRLNADDRSHESARLLMALYAWQKNRHALTLARRMEAFDQLSVMRAIEELQIAKNALGWMFASREKKHKAVSAYEYLQEMLEGEYGKCAQEAEDAFRAVRPATPMDARNGFIKEPIAYLNALEEVCPGMVGGADQVYGLPEELAQSLQKQEILLQGLRCTLRKYQEWGVKYILHQERVLLGDEMGLGKTVQAIAAMVSLRNSGQTHFLVVCPASVMVNWCKEIAKHSDLKVMEIYGSDRMEEVDVWKKEGGVAATTYETAGFISLEEEFSYSLLIVDEAHYIKNPQARRSMHVRRIAQKAQRMLFMTGTALENRVEEMISLIGVLRPQLAAEIGTLAFMSSAPQFREKIAPVYYRRRREDVLTELPELVESQEWCTLSKEEERRYEQAVLEKNYAQARRVSWHMEDVEESSKAQRLREIVEEAKEEGRKVIVFSFFLDTTQKVCRMLGECCTEPINGSIPPEKRQEIVDEFNAAPEGTVLVAQIQSGGTGLNIQSASVVVICEPQFKPSIENQAISRAYRMGQTRNVLVYRLLADNTVDEKMIAMLQEKQAVFDAFADPSEAAEAQMALEINESHFNRMMEEERARIEEKNRLQNLTQQAEMPEKEPSKE